MFDETLNPTMKYNQRMIDQIRSKMPSGMRAEIIEITRLPESTVRDSFITYRKSTKPKRQRMIYDTAVALIRKRGINIKQLK